MAESDPEIDPRFRGIGQYIGSRIRDFRGRRGLNMVTLAATTKALAPHQAVSAAQISRIENGALPHMVDLLLLCAALGVAVADVFPIEAPWYLIREKKAKIALKDSIEGQTIVRRRGDEHQTLTDAGVYRYVALDQSLSEQDEAHGWFHPVMHKYLFSVDHATEAQMVEGMFFHDGQEIIYVLKGELEAWLQQLTPEETRDVVANPDRPPEYSTPIHRVSLKEGDSLQFNSNARHAFRSIGPDRAEALFVYTESRVVPSILEVVRKGDSGTD
ncbi:MAG: XRE family transcriptional regulator [Thermoanaerobaculia bacterium]